jgi:hypothetical protein
MNLLCQSLRIMCAAVDNDSYTFLIQNVNRLFNTIPGCLLPAGMRTSCMSLGVFRNIDFGEIITSDEVYVTQFCLVSHVIARISYESQYTMVSQNTFRGDLCIQSNSLFSLAVFLFARSIVWSSYLTT